MEEFIAKLKTEQDKDVFWLSSPVYNTCVVTETLRAPAVVTNGEVFRPTSGSWEAGRLLEPATLKRWGFIVLEPGARAHADYAGTIASIQRYGREMGMTIAEPTVQQFSLRFEDFKDTLVKCKEKDVQLLFVVLPAGEREYYHKVKQLAEQKVGILTQTIKEETIRKGLKSRVIKSIILKVNSKLMGVNHALHSWTLPYCLQEPHLVMLVGGHVIHPTPEQLSKYKSTAPSIAAVTASIDLQYAKYNVTMSVQQEKKEQIVDFEKMMIEHLRVYRQYHNAFPTTIIYFRSCMPGTPNNEVETYELRALIKAFWRASLPSALACNPKTLPKILFMLVESSTNAKLEKLNWGPTWMEENTIRPGIITYDEKTALSTKRVSSFSMVSKQGTEEAPLSTYFVYKNSGIPYRQLMRLTYQLCFACTRGARAVSCPAPLHYARLGCRRALSFTYGKKYDPERLKKAPIRLHACKSLLEFGRMFFI